MKKVKFMSVVVCLFAVIFTVNIANAELFNRGTDSLGNQLIYDSDLNITWYDYMKSSDYWQTQVDWASALSINFGGNIYDDWRLPATVEYGPPLIRYNITSSEMGHLFYTELGNVGGVDFTFPQNAGLFKTGVFNNLIPTTHWSGTEHSDNPNNAWYFGFSNGSQGTDCKIGCSPATALAVRVGDVAVVPEPISSILFLTGGGVLGLRRLIKRKEGEIK